MALDITRYVVEIELIEELLGTVPKNREVYATHIAAKGREIIEKQAKRNIPLTDGEKYDEQTVAAKMAEEIETIEEVEARGWTGFHTDPEGPFLFDYAIKGFLAESGRTLKERGIVKNLQDKVKRYLFVKPRRVRLPTVGRVEDYEGKPLIVVTKDGLVCERPLRAMTAQGPRVTVTRSDVIPAGGKISFEIEILAGGGLSLGIVEDILAYGAYQGLGQWRSGGWGRFQVNSLAELKAAA